MHIKIAWRDGVKNFRCLTRRCSSNFTVIKAVSKKLNSLGLISPSNHKLKMIGRVAKSLYCNNDVYVFCKKKVSGALLKS